MIARQPGERVEIDYTDARGDRGPREIVPIFLSLTSLGRHAEPQWFLEAWDCREKRYRKFAMTNIHSWKVAREIKDGKRNGY